ncbi:MAG: class I SAM-dependent methyltransferase [Rhizobiaceae bacterium]|nr:class I SAM-dependent methyltransferase [Rhizobiaceae bacterium]
MDIIKAHWENVYTSKGEAEVSWFEQSPDLSLELLAEAAVTHDAAIIDIGGGASRLVDALVARNQAHVAVLDLSANALDRARTRVGEVPVDWIVSDVTAWQPTRRYDAWHDRAAFHFLTELEQQRNYAEVLSNALEHNGVAVIGTFAPDGPEKCSGLPVARHDTESLRQILGPRYSLIAHRRCDHITPWGSIQRFQFSTFRHH